jgi:hypothetical protein
MIVKIKKGQHKSNEWYKLFFGSKLERTYVFTEKSTYDLKDDDQKDWNKLFGFTSGIFIKFKVLFNTDERIKYCDFKVRVPFSKKWYWCVFMPYHWNSARWVCRYNTVDNTYELTSYVYDRGFRVYDNKILKVDLHKKVQLSIEKFKTAYYFKGVNNMIVWEKVIDVEQTKNYGVTLPAFFGGNEVAPNNIEYLIF